MARPGTFTAETSRIAVAKSVATRKAQAIARRERPLIPAMEPLTAPLPTVDDYIRLRLICVRAQLGQVDRAILVESGKDHPDGQRLNWLAQAQDRLSEQERILAGRPLPGSRRPTPEGKRDRFSQSASNGPRLPIEQPPTATNNYESYGGTRGDSVDVVKPSVCNQLQSPIKLLNESAFCNQLQTNISKPIGWEYDEPAPLSSAPSPMVEGSASQGGQVGHGHGG